MSPGADDTSDPAVERVRRELARLGHDAASAPPVPAEVTARIGAALQAARPGPAHSVERPRLRRLHALGLIIGLAAVAVGVVVGASVLMREPASPFPAGPTAESITVSRSSPTFPPAFPLTKPQVLALLSVAPDFGPLSDAQRRAACLDGLGYQARTQVLGARTLDVDGRPALLLVLPGDTADTVIAFVVGPDCSATHTGLVAATVVKRP